MNADKHRSKFLNIGVHLCLSVVSILLISAFAWAGSKPRMEDIAGKIACYCGTCPHLVVTACGCSTADQIKTEIQKMIDSGQSEDQILQGYVAKYGQTVLAAPTKSGFNLTAWIIPFAAFFIGGALLFTYLKKQQRLLQPTPSKEADQADEEEEDSHYRKVLQRELEERK